MRKFNYFAFVQKGDERLAVVVQAKDTTDAWYAARAKTGKGMWVSSVTRLYANDPRTDGWTKEYANLSPWRN